MVTEFNRWWVWALLILSGIVILATLKPISCSGCSSTTVSAESKEKSAEEKQQPIIYKELTPPENFAYFHVPEGDHQFDVPLKYCGDENCRCCWSGKIFIPAGHYWTVDAKFADMIFPNQEIVRIRPGTAVDLGIHPSNSVFKLRGRGTAKVYVQRTPPSR